MSISDKTDTAIPTKHNLIVCGSGAKSVLEACVNWQSLPYDKMFVVDDTAISGSASQYVWVPFTAPEAYYFTTPNLGRFPSGKDIHPVPIPLDLQVLILEPSTQWTVMACLGGVTGTMLYLSIAAYMAGKQNEVRFIGTLPFEFEGVKRRRNAQVVIDFVSSLHSQHVALLEPIKKRLDPCPLAHLFDAVNEEMFAMLYE
ncbi:hypothetical protein ADIS_2011 [Lunatimonas lonarensis]|uniref:Uncharacterized protein n=1 Tax=Lunatimonas lonarensis TaxID=1232681 RepID=R7ZTL0_9BACT|nr:hypothetical protein [Lunatimonas lonarensis]EON77481.1 hypothetical protein ADIS_2011 [Lunatimonas lonarensis]